ncbi:MAG TPA: bifunctional pyr operon transcriptional regulator/uracil phosphoribosyltransferase PyrR [Verrucomicrobiae bacterium]
MAEPKQLLTPAAVQRAVERMAAEIAERNETDQEVVVIGIQRGGIHLACRLADRVSKIWNKQIPCGVVDVSMHRDDLHQQPAVEVHETSIPSDITDKIVVLVDDVLYSGRTTRAALDALSDIGRPKKVQLAVLIDRGHRELPIKADFVGKNVTTSREDRIVVRWRDDGGDDSVALERA